MEQKLDLKQVLRVFQTVVEHGQNLRDEYKLGGLWANTDFDGYTVVMRDEAVTLHIFFHNTHRFTYKRKIDLEVFMGRIKEIDRTRYARD